MVLLVLAGVWGIPGGKNKMSNESETELDDKKVRRDFANARVKELLNGDDEDAGKDNNLRDRFTIFKNNKKKHDRFIKKNKDNPAFQVDEESVMWLKTDAELELLLGLTNLTQIQDNEPKVRPKKMRRGKEKSEKKKGKKDERKKRAKKEKTREMKERGQLRRETQRNKTKRLKNKKKLAAQKNKEHKKSRKAQKAAKKKKQQENKRKKEERKRRKEEKKAQNNRKKKHLVKRQTSDIPSALDLRSLGYVGKVKNQKTCGSCWAFGAVCVIEGALSMAAGKMKRLSEQQIINCNGAQYGCDGGYWPKAWKEIRDNSYIAMNKHQKYKAKRITCNRATKNALGNALNVGTWSILREADDEEAMLGMMVDFGPIAVTIYANADVFYYKSGYLDSCLGGTVYPNHLVTMVGYEHNTLLLKNSWGRFWGDGGYFKIRRNCGIDGFSYWASFATVVPLTANGEILVTEEQEVVVSGKIFNSIITLEKQAVVADLTTIGGLREDTLLVINFNKLDQISDFTISLHNRNLTSTSDIGSVTDSPDFLDRDVRLLTFNTDPITLEWSSETQKCRLLTTIIEPPVETILHEEEHACPLTSGSHFTVLIDVTASGYTITVGETELAHYPHRLELETVTDFRMLYQDGPQLVTEEGVVIEGVAIDGVAMISNQVDILDGEEEELVECFDKDIYCVERYDEDGNGCTTDPWMVENCQRTCGKCELGGDVGTTPPSTVAVP